MRPHFHQQPGSEVTSHSWHYTVIEEGRVLSTAGTAVYVLGSAITGSACCGAGEIRFILVPGLIADDTGDPGADGTLFSMVEPVEDGQIRLEIESRLKKKYPMYQVSFNSL
jgi:hypothetical protein